jgi:hypothetical protein
LVIAFVCTCVSLTAAAAWAQLPSFNGAEGFGGTFTGSAPAGGWFSNASVYHVTTTTDTFDGNGKPVQGTLRGAFYDYTNPSSPKQQASNRIVVFDVGGTFDISAASLDIKTVNNIYIAGQTAPASVTIYGNTAQITKSNNTMTSNVILRYLTFRKGTGNGADAITFAGGSGPGDTVATNMIIDHVSATWSEDEVLSVANNNTNVTVQYAMMTDSLTSGHQYGSLIRPKVNSQVTYQHNLYGNDKSRNPRAGSYLNQQLDLDFRNNVVYNYSDRAGYTGGASETDTEYVNLNYVGNYVIAGPATPVGTSSNTAFTMDVSSFYNLTTNSVIASPKDPIALKAYQSSNLIDSNHNATRDGVDTGWGMFIASDGTTTRPYPDFNYGPNSALPAKSATPFNYAPVTTQPAADAYSQVMSYVGNWWWNRDAIDTRIIGNVQNNTQPAGGIPATAPIPAELALVTSATATNRAAGWDTDNDGMPNNWEVAHALNPNSAADFKTDADADGYVNLQEYLDEVGAFPAPTPLTYVGTASGPAARFSLISNWKTSDYTTTDATAATLAGSNWQPTRFDEARITGGTVTVDAVGQHAKFLRVLGSPANNPTLVVASGWLKIENDLTIGGFGVPGQVNLTGGTLRAGSITKLSGGFSFTGGKLSADTVNFSLTNNGGTLAPGDPIGATETNSGPTNIGQTHVVGDLALNSGTLQIELVSLASFDKLIVDGAATLGGILNVAALNGFTPINGNSWQIITAGGITGGFSSITPGYSVQQQGNNLLLFFGAPPLAGDYNGDGNVDAGDYATWRRALDGGGTLANETASPGIVDQADYDAWRANFGATNAPGTGSTSALSAIPEPAARTLLALAIAAISPLKNRRFASKRHLRVSGPFLQK